MSKYLIGIDLGTTNSALAFIDPRQPVQNGRPAIHTFDIPQLVAPAELAARPLLPSFLYLPGQHDLPAGATALPWDAARHFAVGEFARNHGAKVPGRLATSAKSWLCHAGVDRSAPLLPWNAPPDVPRLSPVEVSARYLRHLVEAWNHVMAKGDDAARLEKQSVVLTVPASFDDVARNLTVEAARKAGLENLTLVEEPQAAFYCWLATHPQAEASRLKPGDLCLVVDVGGGTTDFSLIQAVEQQGELTFVRQAVGDHLLLGGDNMDLALAKFVETRLPAAGRLDAVQYGMLTQACRLAKETLLSPSGERGRGEGHRESFTVTVMGRGRAVVAGTLHAAITPADVHRILFDGFLPQAPRDAGPQQGARTGLHEMGLPYVSDPAITRHLAGFLKQHGVVAPDAILFNGGVFQPVVLRDRLVGQLRQWFDTPGAAYHPLVLTNPSLDLAVSWGAAYYAWLRHTGGKRIGGGIARSYYVGVERKAKGSEMHVLCVVPQHLEEGEEITLAEPELELAIGQPVKFPLYTSTVRGDDKAGDLLSVAPEQLLQLPPLHTILRGGKRAGVRQVPVMLAAKSTEVGTLELWCVAREGSNRWRLEFNVRDIVQDPASRERERPEQERPEQESTALTDVWPEAQVQAAASLIRQVYAGTSPTPQELPKHLESALEAGRSDWPTGLCRRLWDFLQEVADQRRRSPAHLGRWYNLTGYCLRPGFGDPLDRFRVETLWKLMHAQRPLTLPSPPGGEGGVRGAPRQPEGGADFWIMWRRVGGGLPGQLQQSLADRLRPILLPAKGKAGIKPGPNELAEMWRAVASLERIDGKHKEALGQVLLKQCRRSPVPTYAFWSLTRLGARKLLYGPLNAVVHHQVVETWLDSLAGFQPTNDSERLGWAFCLAQLARRTGQRALDVGDSHRATVLTALRGLSIPGHWVQMVQEVVDSEREEDSRMFGEALPLGLRLIQSEDS